MVGDNFKLKEDELKGSYLKEQGSSESVMKFKSDSKKRNKNDFRKVVSSLFVVTRHTLKVKPKRRCSARGMGNMAT